MIGLYGGSFDPPHNGHVALVRAALDHFDLHRLVILVSEDPGHKPPVAPADVRVQLARAAFPGLEIELDPYPRTIDMLCARNWDDPIFLVGADQFEAFAAWREPDAVLEHTRLGVAARPGYEPRVEHDRVELFDMPPVDVSSSEVRRRVAAGEPIHDLVPPAVADLIEKLGVYRH
jgi:nicotinate-nucleotide adenylyltransferase